MYLASPNKGVKMNRWSFKSARLGEEGAILLVPLSRARRQRISHYTAALGAAVASRATWPTFSSYHVRESISVSGGAMIPAGNVEYGFCQALHAEEAAVAALFSTRNGGGRIINGILAIIAGTAGNLAMPCGNCRDILRQVADEDIEIISGAANGGIAIVVALRDAFFDRYATIPLDKLSVSDIDVMRLAMKGEKLAHDPYSTACSSHPLRRYHAVIVTSSKEYIGARSVNCDYHPTYAIEDAIRQAQRVCDPFIKSVIVIAEGDGSAPPDVMYRDRQHLLEFNLEAELLRGNCQDPAVVLYAHSNNKITGAWQTSVKEWLPFPFSPRNFGEEFLASHTIYLRQRYQ